MSVPANEGIPPIQTTKKKQRNLATRLVGKPQEFESQWLSDPSLTGS